MAIVKMSKFSLFAFEKKRENLLRQMQKFKYVHFIKNEEISDQDGLVMVETPESIVALEEEISKVNFAIDLLSSYKEKETGLKALQTGLETLNFAQLEERASGIDYLPLYNQLRELSNNKQNLEQKADKLKNEIEELRPWIKLNIPIGSLKGFNRTVVFQGTIPKKLLGKLERELLDMSLTHLEILSEDKDNSYLIVISEKGESQTLEDILRNNGFSNITLKIEGKPEDEIAALEKEIKGLEDEIRNYDEEIRKFSDKLNLFEIVYEYLNNLKLRESSSENFLRTDSINFVEGYIPTERKDEFKKIIEEVVGEDYYLDIKDAQMDDPYVPVMLKNSKFAQTFESLTGMYALPSYNEIDPTPFLAPFYLLFFGMMAADIAYGFIMLIGTFFAMKKFNLSESTKNFVKFFYYLSFSVILWGFIYGSFFGGIVPIKGLIDPAVEYNTILVISIIFGLIHVYFALGLKAYISIRDGNIMDALYDVGFWYMALTGGIVYLVSILVSIPPALKTISLGVMIAGMVGIILTGGRESKKIGARLGGGIYSLYGISGYIGDFVSYSRLMALGLSGGFIAGAINMMAGMLVNKGIIGIILATIIFIGGQVFNLGLSLLGAYVHTIRLTFVEFFGKFYNGGGQGFKMFNSSPKYINLK